MSDITHSDWCIVDKGGALEDCEACLKYLANRQAYYADLYRAEREPYTAEDIRDAYSDPTEYHKRERLLRDL